MQGAISKKLLKIHQTNGFILTLNVDCVKIIAANESSVQIIHTIIYGRGERIGIFPSFDYEDFPFVLR